MEVELFHLLAIAMSSESDPTPKKRKNYDLKFKLDAAKHAEKYDISKAAKQFGVDRKQVRNWISQKAELKVQL